MLHPPPTAHPADRASTFAFSRSIALVVGVNGYGQGVPPLRTPINDAARLAALLRETFAYDDVRLLADCTRAGFLAALESLKPHCTGETRLLFYFAGHGLGKFKKDEGPTGYLLFRDAVAGDITTYLPMQELYDALTALDSRHLLTILDCCFAGAMRWATRSLFLVDDVLYRQRYDRYIRDPAWQVIASAARDETALDVARAERGDVPHSPFALALFDALSGQADLVPRQKGDGVVTASELYLYLRERVELESERQNHRQTPQSWQLPKHLKGEYIFLLPGYDDTLPEAPPLDEAANPYRGLNPYEESNASTFFGRAPLTARLVDRVQRESFTVLYGASGTGKSSVVKAGVIPALRAAGGWEVLPVLRPTATPLAALGALTQGRPLSGFLDQWRGEHPDTRLLLVVDQAEELLTLCRDDTARDDFAGQLANALAMHPQALHVLFTIRSDFEPQLQKGALEPLWHDARVAIPPMSPAELREAVEGPATARVMFFDPPALVDRLTDDVNATPSALPLLSFTLSEMYRRYLARQGHDRALTEADYDALGGVAGALTRRADDEYERLPDDAHRATLRRILLRMTTAEGGELARRRVPDEELLYPDSAENERVRLVLENLVAARLLVEAREEGAGDFVEPAHDALVRGWAKLTGWWRDEQESLPLQRRLSQAAGEWARASDREKRDFLWDDDPRLPQVEAALTGRLSRRRDRLLNLLPWRAVTVRTGPNWFNQRETEFARSSIAAYRQGARRFAALTVGIIVLLAGLSAFALLQSNRAARNEAIAIANQLRAEEEARVATSRQLAAQSGERLLAHDLSNALLLAVSALRLSPTGEAYQAMNAVQARDGLRPRAILDHPLDVDGALWGRQGSEIFTWSADRIARRWDARTGAELGAFHHGAPLGGIAPDPAAERLATWGGDVARVWNVANPAVVASLQHPDTVAGLQWSPRGDRVLSWSQDGSIYVWDPASGAVQLDFFRQGIEQARWSPDGRQMLAATAQDDILVWDFARAAGVATLPHDSPVTGAIWSPDGTAILSWTLGGATTVWDVTTQRARFSLQDNCFTSIAPSWSPDGSRLLAPTSGGLGEACAVTLLDAATGNRLRDYPVTPYASGGAFSPDGALALFWSSGSAEVWDLATLETVVTVDHRGSDTDVTGAFFSAAWSADSSRFATVRDDSIRIWHLDPVRAGEVEVLPVHEMPAGLLWSADNRTVLSWQGKTVRIWAAARVAPLVISPGFPSGVRLNSERSRVLAVDGSLVRLSDSETGALTALLPHPVAVAGTSWITGTQEVITWDEAFTVRVWDATLGTLLAEATVPDPVSPGRVGFLRLAGTSPRGDFAFLSPRGLTIWRNGTRGLLHYFLEGEPLLARWNRDGALLLAGTPGHVYQFSAETEALVADIALSDIFEYGSVDHLDWTGNDQAIAIATLGAIAIYDRALATPLCQVSPRLSGSRFAQWGSDILELSTAEFRLISLPGCEERYRHAVPSTVDPYAFDLFLVNGGREFFLVDPAAARLFETGSGELVAEFPLRPSGVTGSPTGFHFEFDMERQQLLLWFNNGVHLIDLPARRVLLEIAHAPSFWGITHAEWNPDHTLLLTSSGDGTARVTDPRTGRPLLIIAEPGRAAWDDGGKSILISERGLSRWPFDPQLQIDRACEYAERDFTAEERALYLGDALDGQPVCPAYLRYVRAAKELAAAGDVDRAHAYLTQALDVASAAGDTLYFTDPRAEAVRLTVPHLVARAHESAAACRLDEAAALYQQASALDPTYVPIDPAAQAAAMARSAQCP